MTGFFEPEFCNEHISKDDICFKEDLLAFCVETASPNYDIYVVDSMYNLGLPLTSSTKGRFLVFRICYHGEEQEEELYHQTEHDSLSAAMAQFSKELKEAGL